MADNQRQDAERILRQSLLRNQEKESKIRARIFILNCPILFIQLVREDLHKTEKEYNKSEDDLKALQSAGQILGEVLRQLDEDRCMSFL
jgi:hypothetical protein